MQKGKLRNQNMNALNVFDILFVLVLGSALDVWPFYVGCAIFFLVVAYRLNAGRFLLCKPGVLVSMLFVVGVLSTILFLFMQISDLTAQDINQVVFRTRKFSMEFFVGFSLYSYARLCAVEKIYKLIFLAVFINFIVGVVEFSMSPFNRLNLLFFEPSSAAFFLLFAVAFILGKPDKNWFEKLVVMLFILICVLVGSKALILSFLLLLVAYSVKAGFLKGGVVLLIGGGVTAILVMIYWNDIAEYSELVRSTVVFLKVFVSDGMAGLQIEKGVYGTFVTRITSLVSALYLFVTKPLGIGFGAFGSLYIPTMDELGLSFVVTGAEVESYLLGDAVPSPKSKLLELLLSTGWVGAWVLGYFVYSLREAPLGKVLVWATVCVLMGAVFIELNNMYMYLFVISAAYASSVNTSSASPREIG